MAMRVPAAVSVAQYVPTGVPYIEYISAREYELDLRKWLHIAWEVYRANWLNLTGVLVVLLFVVAISRVFGAFVFWYMTNGFMVMILNSIRDGELAIRETRFGDVFTAWSYFFPLLAITAGLFGVALITFSPTIYLLEETSLSWFWDFAIFSLCTLVFFSLLAFVVFAPLILMEHYRDGREGAAPLTRAAARAANEPSELSSNCGFGVISALRCSIMQTRRQFMPVLTGLMACFSVAFSGLFFLGIGVLITFPIGAVMFVIMFREIFGVRETDVRPGNCLFCGCK
ncbi:uncharacterized protein AMSG_09225 [Thecamonas trahens ATCC 50062]|uniref:Transmembrane protein n=1 Tax=Thecamonas trahens ATCC 50062 TaxID=461836 RepID=A0A0L0DP13_THETB|nr:hypothetical protein AMSG_09225 [Thecamonas trahens ATCC 50062]KNC53148.1 hypothetical protein AMSG_09225 [Thecamonas trahens ATCC 50062]|eukprot:XP_013754621.1 hypothetical protein AMSG_09225 [Thecamonas trahens ATCC 50062]